ncbi:MAG: colicin production protein [Rickettsiaceae bacterium]|jgi:membrane protein required for colicin V production|nr:colicin production protein [Rickettsiaceae bacterium]
MSLTPNHVDAILFLTLFIFAFLAFLKGFIRDFFSMLNLILATLASCFITPLISKLFGGESSRILVDLSISFIVFVVVLIVCSIISSKISDPLSEKIPRMVDQSLGFGFGFVKGYLIISLVFAIFLALYPNLSSSKSKSSKIGPSWFTKSRSYDFFYVGAKMIKPLVNNMTSQIEDSAKDYEQDREIDEDKPVEDSIFDGPKLYKEEDVHSPTEKDSKPKNTNKPTEANKKDEDAGYTKQERERMKRLIEIMSN